MLRALLLSVAILAVGSSLCAAQQALPAPKTASKINQVIQSQPTPDSNSAAEVSSDEDFAAENELLEDANKGREAAGAPPLRMDGSLREAAREHARRMIASERLEHQLPGEAALLDRIAQATSSESAPKVDRAGENLANATCAPGANDALMHSPPHRQNLLDTNFSIVGVAAIWHKGRLYVVQDFAHEVPSYSAKQAEKLVGEAISETRQRAGLAELAQLTPPNLDRAACSLAAESRPNAHLLATAYTNQRIITYTQSRPEVLPQAALPLLSDPNVRQFAVGSCYARNAAYPTGTYWVAILLY